MVLEKSIPFSNESDDYMAMWTNFDLYSAFFACAWQGKCLAKGAEVSNSDCTCLALSSVCLVFMLLLPFIVIILLYSYFAVVCVHLQDVAKAQSPPKA